MDAAANPVITTPVKPPRKGLLSPTNIRRWHNFKANRLSTNNTRNSHSDQ
ncbi:hypothetical protein [Rhizobium johnstonii]